MQDTIQKTTEELLNLIGLEASVSVEEDKEASSFSVNISTEEAGILIGRHGDTISSFQLVLNQIVGKTTGEWQRIVVNCGDYRERQAESLQNLAISAAERAKETGKPQYLYDLSAEQRRIVHMHLSEDSEVQTESQGEGRERCLVVSLKS